MADAEQIATVAAGVAGLVAFAGGSMLVGAPPIDAELGHAVETPKRRRTPILVGSMLSSTGSALPATCVPSQTLGAIVAVWSHFRAQTEAGSDCGDLRKKRERVLVFIRGVELSDG